MVPLEADNNIVESSITVFRRGMGPNEVQCTPHREGILNDADAASFVEAVEEIAVRVAGKEEHNGNSAILLTTKVNGKPHWLGCAFGVFTLEEAVRIQEDAAAMLSRRLDGFKAKKGIA